MRYSVMRKDIYVAQIPVLERASVTGQCHATTKSARDHDTLQQCLSTH